MDGALPHPRGAARQKGARMTVVALRPHRAAKPGGARHVVEIERHELVGLVMDAQALASAAIDANGYSLQTVLRLPSGPWRQEMQAAHHDTHKALVALLKELRMAAGRYDGVTPRIGA